MTLPIASPGANAALKSDVQGDIHIVHHRDTDRAELLAALAQLDPDAGLGAIVTALVGKASDAGLAAIVTALQGTLAVSATALPLPDGAATQATQASILGKLIAAPATEAKQTELVSAVGLVGTRAYSAPAARVAVGSTAAYSAVLTATEVLLHASTRCFVGAVAASGTPSVTTDFIPLEIGEKFHLRITSGQRIGVVRDTADGFLNIVPVA